MKATSSGLPVLAVLLALPAPAARGHDTWLLPERGAAPSGTRVALDLTSGMAFPAPETAIAPERVRRSGLRLGARVAPLTKPRTGPRSLRLDAALDGMGVGTAWVELLPRGLELTPEDVDHYLTEIGATATVGPLWRARPEPRRWIESYRKHAKSFIRAGDPGGDTSWREPVGLDLELVPEVDPTALHVGDRLWLRLLRQGSPLAGLAVAATDGSGGRTLERSDAAGRVSFVLGREGPWLLAATDLRPAADGAWESDFTTLTVFVGASGSRH
jgi:uncharacterized GH25 family protein